MTGGIGGTRKFKWFIDAARDYGKKFPAQFRLPTHNGKNNNPEYDRFQRDEMNPKMIDGSWFGLANLAGMDISEGRLVDLGSNYHEIFNSELTLFLQNGSTIGNHIGCMALAKKKVLIQSNAHFSVFIGLLMAGAEIVLVHPRHNLEYDLYYPIGADQVEESIKKRPDIDAIYLTSPTFEGLICDYKSLRSVVG